MIALPGVSTLPVELTRNFGLIKELDEKSSGSSRAHRRKSSGLADMFLSFRTSLKDRIILYKLPKEQ